MMRILRFNESYEKQIVFTHKNNRNITIIVKKTPDGRISSIVNKSNIRFPFQVGQLLRRDVETWACNNNFLIDGEDLCPEGKVFGIRVSDIPINHEFRRLYPNKFKK